MDSLIERVMKKHPGTSPAALLKYFEEVHQELAPLARALETMMDHANEAKNNAVAAERIAILERVNALIRTGNLTEPSHSERNGIVLAYNAITAMGDVSKGDLDGHLHQLQ
ncbi:hypothetical protein [Paludibacterium denitrificans]|uniref:hypothetical protein n=1 Tax=Paludibacterium denitrificans TaxID=2675226 RepID=UPI001E5140CC|nr:hypothetical protein [Paludibacterium denitrificans]